uniref:Podoplanin n=1 Tax=Parastrongyloides trichosuri TaxID=131310 RepID=A0A0N4ZQZ7_PARTI
MDIGISPRGNRKKPKEVANVQSNVLPNNQIVADVKKDITGTFPANGQLLNIPQAPSVEVTNNIPLPASSGNKSTSNINKMNTNVDVTSENEVVSTNINNIKGGNSKKKSGQQNGSGSIIIIGGIVLVVVIIIVIVMMSIGLNKKKRIRSRNKVLDQSIEEEDTSDQTTISNLTEESTKNDDEETFPTTESIKLLINDNNNLPSLPKLKHSNIEDYDNKDNDLKKTSDEMEGTGSGGIVLLVVVVIIIILSMMGAVIVIALIKIKSKSHIRK